jgi:hypothetical protein
LGVHHFKKILPVGDWWIKLFNLLFSKKLRVVKSKQDAITWVIFTLSVESLHLLAFLVILGFTIEDLIHADYQQATKALAINLLVNVYPVFVQRYNRTRLLRIFQLTFRDVKNFKLEI